MSSLADSIPELDLILGGHEHENWIDPPRTAIHPHLKADANVRIRRPSSAAAPPRSTARRRVAARPDHRLDPGRPRGRGPGRALDRHRLRGLPPGRPRSPERVIATFPAPLDAREAVVRNGENDFTRLLTAALRADAPDADVALMNSGSIRLDDVLAAGAGHRIRCDPASPRSAARSWWWR